MIASVFAMSENRVIGKDNQLPWHLPADLKFFKNLTTGHPIIMGRKTFESIGKPLPHRTSIIITRQAGYSPPNCIVLHDVPGAIQEALTINPNVFIIGGAEVLQQALPFIDTMYLTLIHAHFEGDTFYPEIDPAQWQEVSRQNFEADEKNLYPYSFIKLQKSPGLH
ncbi:dihydrofolate reductase [Adhaeribacter pallidiroseus]|uniref:Dihydrofolate reductase n=1 Tax=Adhaeribacter pallidiroseus TaxID=2072847 RepID=A0A369QFU0_9BACT|nr:dihydrofolate reductase [Adhaeribacter pallidiroseus]RDC63564.1 Dihydrofolate reductase [Adhaeribacter pallidiroseus]